MSLLFLHSTPVCHLVFTTSPSSSQLVHKTFTFSLPSFIDVCTGQSLASCCVWYNNIVFAWFHREMKSWRRLSTEDTFYFQKGNRRQRADGHSHPRQHLHTPFWRKSLFWCRLPQSARPSRAALGTRRTGQPSLGLWASRQHRQGGVKPALSPWFSRYFNLNSLQLVLWDLVQLSQQSSASEDWALPPNRWSYVSPILYPSPQPQAFAKRLFNLLSALYLCPLFLIPCLLLFKK